VAEEIPPTNPRANRAEADLSLASDKQIAANRANAKKSTGPKTAAGKLKSSQNAFRHGFSVPLHLDPATSAEVESLTRALAGEDANPQQEQQAAEFGQAHLMLQRIGMTRERWMASLDMEQPEFAALQKIATLDRYERYAFTKRRRASRALQESASDPG
jgi:hypothetical protein